MIQMKSFSGGVLTLGTPEYEEYEREYEKNLTQSYDDYRTNGHEWCWGLVGNIKQTRE